MDFLKYIFSRGLPKTGQTVQYRLGDDGTYESGWWIKRLIATNRTRYVDKTINGDVVVIDRATKLMWPKNWAGDGANSGNAVTWNDGIDWALALDFAGFKDWRLPNYFEIVSLLNFSLYNPSFPTTVFDNVDTITYWTSTTYPVTTTSAFRTGLNNVSMYWEDKSGTNKVIAVRNSH